MHVYGHSTLLNRSWDGTQVLVDSTQAFRSRFCLERQNLERKAWVRGASMRLRLTFALV